MRHTDTKQEKCTKDLSMFFLAKKKKMRAHKFCGQSTQSNDRAHPPPNDVGTQINKLFVSSKRRRTKRLVKLEGNVGSKL